MNAEPYGTLPDTQPDKRKLRSKMKELLRQKPGTIEDNDRLLNNILGSSYWGRAQQVFLFLPLHGEPDLTALIPIAQAEGKTIAAPHCEKDTLFFHQLSADWQESTIETPFGVREPDSSTTPLCEVDSSTLVLVPGRAFTKEGARLGRGKGYYDHFLGDIAPENIPMTLGTCWSWQILEHVPTWPGDRPVQGIVTEQELHEVQ